MNEELLTSLSSTAIVGGLVIFLVRWMVNQMSEQLKVINRSLSRLTLSHFELYKLFLAHDAQIRGVNPTAGEDSEEAHKLATQVYAKLIDSLEEMQAEIKIALQD